MVSPPKITSANTHIRMSRSDHSTCPRMPFPRSRHGRMVSLTVRSMILQTIAYIQMVISSKAAHNLRLQEQHAGRQNRRRNNWNRMPPILFFLTAPLLSSCIPPRVELFVSADVGPLVTAQCLLGGPDSKRSAAPKCLLAHGGSVITYSFVSNTHELFATSAWKFPSRAYRVLTPECSAELRDQIASQLSSIRAGCPVAAASPPWRTKCEIRTYQGPYSSENRSHGEICPNPVEIP